jgi:Ca2+-binding EF-hand superfamily protein
MPNWFVKIAAATMLLNASAALAQETTVVGAEVGMNAMDFDAARNSFFYQNDRDGDFALSFSEMSEAMSQGGSRLFDGYDLDGDGLISYDEYIQTGSELFLSLDADGDGILSSLEM